MKIAETSNEQYRMTLSPEEMQIFIKGMKETIQRLTTREYQTRMGAEVHDIQSVIASLESSLK
jgi:hypothetical protein